MSNSWSTGNAFDWCWVEGLSRGLLGELSKFEEVEELGVEEVEVEDVGVDSGCKLNLLERSRT